MKTRILHVVGARPNFVKVAPVMLEFAGAPEAFQQLLVHTGQHYDANMSRVFFDELEIPKPDINLDVGSGSHAWQNANVMLRLEPVLSDFRPDWVMVYGDTNSTLAAALVSANVGIPVAHVEAGLRSFDRTMPEELNRVLTDRLSDALFTPSRDADANLAAEGIDATAIHFVGNVMIDTLLRALPQTDHRQVLDDLGLARKPGEAEAKPQKYIVATLHRPANVDELRTLKQIVDALSEAARTVPVVFPVHPRTREAMARNGLSPSSGIMLIEPLGYLDFICLVRHAEMVVTDSGGVQEETTYLQVPCLTVRPNTERPITVTQGTNRLVAAETAPLIEAINDTPGRVEREPVYPDAEPPELWDGRAATRIASILSSLA